MARTSKYPFILDTAKQLSITDLKRLGFFNGKTRKTATLSWKCYGEYTGSIGIRVITTNEIPMIVLSYKCNDEVIDYTIHLTRIRSNLGNGYYYYFICPITKRKCRKLFLYDKYFVHRSIASDCYYQKQIQSHFYRAIRQMFETDSKKDQLNELIYKRYAKKHYRGKPTRNVKRLQKLYEKEFDMSSIQRYILS